jgi:sucrose phosphorylase
VWTTFSQDQIDLNFQNEEVLLQIVEVLLYYVRRGADLIRLDAVTYLWAELGTSCALLKETHSMVQLFRAVLDVVAPQVALVTETNVPHENNIGYLADGISEAQMVYNFALPPLVLQAFQTGKVDKLSEWAESLEQISDQATYFNFLDSHDGIGLLPIRTILSEKEIDQMLDTARDHGGLVSYRTEADGSESPYEINITWFSALNKPDSGEPQDLQINRFVASRSVGLVLMGVPGIYLPSMVGQQNDLLAVVSEGELRSINRTVLDEEALIQRLNDPNTMAHEILRKFGCLIQTRIKNPAFHPNASQQVLHLQSSVFSVLREQPGRGQRILALTNVTKAPQQVALPLHRNGLPGGIWKDLLSSFRTGAENGLLSIDLTPFQVKWMTPDQADTES